MRSDSMMFCRAGQPVLTENFLVILVTQSAGCRQFLKFLLSMLLRFGKGLSSRLGCNKIQLVGDHVDEVQFCLELFGQRVSVLQCQASGLRKIRGGQYPPEWPAGADLVAPAGNAITGHELSRSARISDGCEVTVMHVTCHM